jgi:hypothetical protein
MTMGPKTFERVRRIYEGRAQGISLNQLAKEFGLSGQRVDEIKRRWLDGEQPPELKRQLEDDLYRRWIEVHDIRAIGTRAVEETAA